MRSIKNWLALGAFSLLVLGIPAVASAQWNGGQYDPYGRNGQYDPYGRNNDPYGNNSGYYGNSNNVIRNLKSKTRDFQRQLDRDLDRSRYNGTRREDQINETAKRFRDAVNDLDNNYYNSRNNNRNDSEMRRVFDYASQIERAIGRADISYNSRNLWSSIRNDLQVISRNYNVYNNGNNGGYNNGNGRNNGGWGNSRGNRQGLPSWWPF